MIELSALGALNHNAVYQHLEPRQVGRQRGIVEERSWPEAAKAFS